MAGVLRTVTRHPWLTVMLLAALFVLCWGAGMAWSFHAPTADSAEQLAWSYALELGYWKHPPLPSWIMHALVALFGPSVALPFFAAHACTAIALVLTWRLGCEFMSPRRSLAAAALTALVGFHAWANHDYNHNSALLPFQAATVLCFWFAVRRARWGWWLLAGAFAGLALLVKYVALLPLAAMGLYFLADRRLHSRRQIAGAVLACATAVAVLAPHLAWLAAHQFLPLSYARAVAVHAPDLLGWLREMAHFLLAQLGQLAFPLLAAAWRWRPRRGTPSPAREPIAPEARRFLWIVGISPLALLLVYAAATETVLEPRWGSNLYLLSGWLLLDALGPSQAVTRGALRVGVLLQVAVWAAVACVIPALAAAIHWQTRAQFPGETLARNGMAAWDAATHAPLRIVVGEVWLGGTMIAYAGRPLAVLGEGQFFRSPWVQARDLTDCGALVLQDRSVPVADWFPEVTRLVDGAPVHGEWLLPWAPNRGLRRQEYPEGRRIAWAVVPPKDAARCRL